ncbi:MAG: phenylacetate--CoA ligase [Oscillospiraceae bacterium]|nr:phenylacetate--CoA ligase [Oscillospiraceae bacterium]
MKYWDEKHECMSREQMRALQSERLIETVKRVYEHQAPYRKKMDEIGLKPEDIKSVDDLTKLPFTVKQDLRDNYPYGLFAVNMDDIVRIHASSGTTGKQTVVGYTQNDLDMWADMVARVFTAAGADKKSIFQIAYGYGLFTGGLGAHYGAEKIGAAVVPISVGNTSRQVRTLVDFGVTHIACTPSYVIYLAETLKEMGIKKEELKLKYGIFGAEPWSDEMRKKIEDELGITAIDIYGLSEIVGPGVSFSCEENNGLHINEDNFIPEIINPETGEPMPEGELGELVFTTITKEGLPLIRYRTRDICSLSYEKCACGRTLARMSKPCGRSDDMLIIRGVNVFPSQIESVLLEMGNTSPHYLLIVDRKGALDTLEIQVELSEESFASDEIKYVEKLGAEIKKQVESTLGIAAKITLVEPKSIERSAGKAVRVIDKRKI